jgi:transcriptional regulator GlxA family with amidase domain
LKVEHEHLHLDPDFNGEALARIIGVSHDRLIRLFRNKTIHRSPEAYISNLRVLTAMRLLREKPQYSIAAIANDAGFSNVRALQRHLQDALGMTPVEYRQMLTRDC